MQFKDKSEKMLVSKERVTIEVSGKKFKAQTEHFLRHPSTRLGKLFLVRKESGEVSNEDLIFDRPAVSFEAILSYYQTGELHIPVNVCPKAFQKELEFWDIDPGNLEDCCLYKYMSYLNECKSISTFQDYIADEPIRCPSKVWRGRCNNIRNRIWIILSNKDKSKLTKIYLIISMIMISMSLATLIFGTIPEFQTPITTCDMKELLTELGWFDEVTSDVLDDFDCLSDPIAQIESLIDSKNKTRRHFKRTQTTTATASYPHVNEDTISDDKEGSYFTTASTATATDSRHFGNDYTKPDDKIEIDITAASTAIEETTVSDRIETKDRTMENVIKGGTNLQTEENYDFDSLTEKEVFTLMYTLNKLKDLYLRKPMRLLLILDDITVAFFTIELILRLVCCPNYKRYFKSIINIFDIVILLAAYINYIVTQLTVKAEYDRKGIVRILQYIQMFRVLRVLRITQNIVAVRVLGYSLKRSLKDILALAIYLFIGVIIFSTFLYFSENTDQMKSIPDACWWGVITMTTVGYGDIVPKSPIGRLVGSICAISGLILLSMVIPVFVNNFLTIYQVAKLQDVLKKSNTCSYVEPRRVSEVKVYPIATKE